MNHLACSKCCGGQCATRESCYSVASRREPCWPGGGKSTIILSLTGGWESKRIFSTATYHCLSDGRTGFRWKVPTRRGLGAGQEHNTLPASTITRPRTTAEAATQTRAGRQGDASRLSESPASGLMPPATPKRLHDAPSGRHLPQDAPEGRAHGSPFALYFHFSRCLTAPDVVHTRPDPCTNFVSGSPPSMQNPTLVTRQDPCRQSCRSAGGQAQKTGHGRRT